MVALFLNPSELQAVKHDLDRAVLGHSLHGDSFIWTIPTQGHWGEARAIATSRGGRLLSEEDAKRWADREQLNMDFWLDGSVQATEELASYWDGTNYSCYWPRLKNHILHSKAVF